MNASAEAGLHHRPTASEAMSSIHPSMRQMDPAVLGVQVGADASPAEVAATFLASRATMIVVVDPRGGRPVGVIHRRGFTRPV